MILDECHRKEPLVERNPLLRGTPRGEEPLVERNPSRGVPLDDMQHKFAKVKTVLSVCHENDVDWSCLGLAYHFFTMASRGWSLGPDCGEAIISLRQIHILFPRQTDMKTLIKEWLTQLAWSCRKPCQPQ
uniref:Death domain-containing protein n=1 Tax=Bursaphelenchus xylophilus TaxID=6326 RepID=A0A1I7SI73_BURXY